MKLSSKSASFIIKTTTLTAFILAGMTGTALADELTVLPVARDGYVANPTLSLKGGVNSMGIADEISPQLGVELAIDCPLLDVPVGQIRQQVSYNYIRITDSARVHTVEANPHWMYPLTEAFWLGGGPGFGYTNVKVLSFDAQHNLGLNLGASAHLNLGKVFVGLESRYQWGFFGDLDADNFANTAKLGISF